MSLDKCPNCGGRNSLRWHRDAHCGSDDCTWVRCSYCFAVANFDGQFFIDRHRGIKKS